jgi:hypothetical protein
MSSHHDDHNHSTEPKKVHFSTPLIMGLVTILLILIALGCQLIKVVHQCCLEMSM